MATDDSTATQERAKDSNKGSRGTANKGISNRSRPERNYDDAAFFQPVEGRIFKAVGLDIGKTSFAKKGVAENFINIKKAYDKAPGSEIHISGMESPSVRRGSDADLAKHRAEAARDFLIGMGIPGSAIHIDTIPRSTADPRTLKPETKATLRGAVIEVVPPKEVKYTPKGFNDSSTFVEGETDPPIKWPRIWPPPVDPQYLLYAIGLAEVAPFAPELLLAAGAIYGLKKWLEPGENLPEKPKDQKKKKRKKVPRVLHVHLGPYGLYRARDPFPNLRSLIDIKYFNANYLILASGQPARFVPSIKERARRAYLKGFQIENEWEYFKEVVEAMRGLDVDESLSLQLGGRAVRKNQNLFPPRLNSALGIAERSALLSQGFELGDLISSIEVDYGKEKDVQPKYVNYEWYEPRGTQK